MSSEKTYHALIPDKIFMGAAIDVESMVKNEGIEVIVDLRGDAAECAYPAANAKWIQIPLADNAAMPQEKAFEQAIQAVTQAYHQSKKVAFHRRKGTNRYGSRWHLACLGIKRYA